MEFIVGISGPGYVLMASDTIYARSVLVMKSDKDKFNALSKSLLLACFGEPGEADRLRERLFAEATLASFRIGRSLTTTEAANFSRTVVAESLRSRVLIFFYLDTICD